MKNITKKPNNIPEKIPYVLWKLLQNILTNNNMNGKEKPNDVNGRTLNKTA